MGYTLSRLVNAVIGGQISVSPRNENIFHTSGVSQSPALLHSPTPFVPRHSGTGHQHRTAAEAVIHLIQ